VSFPFSLSLEARGQILYFISFLILLTISPPRVPNGLRYIKECDIQVYERKWHLRAVVFNNAWGSLLNISTEL
jgi:hypothetical protein